MHTQTKGDQKERKKNNKMNGEKMGEKGKKYIGGKNNKQYKKIYIYCKYI